MDRRLWKLDRIGERLWVMATLIAAHAASLEGGGKGLAVVAEETRRTGDCIHHALEKLDAEEGSWDQPGMKDLADRLGLLALNGAIEASRIIGFTGRQASIYAGEIQSLAGEILCLFDEQAAAKRRQLAAPWAAAPSQAARNGEFLLLQAGGIPFVEPVANIQEVCVGATEGESIRLRGTSYPRIDLWQLLGKKPESRTHVIVHTPWAGENRTCAVAAEALLIFCSPAGRPMQAPAAMPLARFIRECWENENGEPFYFMDWAEMI